IIIAVPEPRSGDFLLLVQEKVTKEKDTPNGAKQLLALLGFGALAEPQDLRVLRLGRTRPVCAPDGLHPKPCDARSRAIRGPNSNPRQHQVSWFVVLSPSEQAEHRRASSGNTLDGVRARAASFSPPASLARKRLARRRVGDDCAIRGRLFFGYFLLAKQKKVSRPRFGNRNYNLLRSTTRRQALDIKQR